MDNGFFFFFGECGQCVFWFGWVWISLLGLSHSHHSPSLFSKVGFGQKTRPPRLPVQKNSPIPPPLIRTRVVIPLLINPLVTSISTTPLFFGQLITRGVTCGIPLSIETWHARHVRHPLFSTPSVGYPWTHYAHWRCLTMKSDDATWNIQLEGNG